MAVVGGRPGFPDAEESMEDETEFARFYREAHPLARRLAGFAVEEPADADDIAAEVLAQAFETWSADPAAYEWPKNLKGWLTIAVMNRAKDFHKTRRRRAERQFVYQFDLAGTKTAWMDPDEAMRLQGLRRAKMAALAKLSEERRRCFLRKHEDDASHKDIAAALGITVKKVAENIGYAYKALREAEQEFLRRGS